MIFFDIDGTLINHLSAAAAASLSFYDYFTGKIPFSREGFPELWEAIVDKHFDRYCRAEISVWEQRRARMREIFGDERLPDTECDTRYRVYIERYESLTRAFDDAFPCLNELQGTPLGIISNGAREQQIGKLARAGLSPYFSVLVFSEDVGIGKPAKKIFEEACRLAGAGPTECVHVGDNLSADVAGSSAAGIQPVWLDRYGRDPGFLAAPRVSGLRELNSVLKNDVCISR